MLIQTEADRNEAPVLSPSFPPYRKSFPSSYKYTPETHHVLKHKTPLKVIIVLQNSLKSPVASEDWRAEPALCYEPSFLFSKDAILFD